MSTSTAISIYIYRERERQKHSYATFVRWERKCPSSDALPYIFPVFDLTSLLPNLCEICVTSARGSFEEILIRRLTEGD